MRWGCISVLMMGRVESESSLFSQIRSESLGQIAQNILLAQSLLLSLFPGEAFCPPPIKLIALIVFVLIALKSFQDIVGRLVARNR